MVPIFKINCSENLNEKIKIVRMKDRLGIFLSQKCRNVVRFMQGQCLI